MNENPITDGLEAKLHEADEQKSLAILRSSIETYSLRREEAEANARMADAEIEKRQRELRGWTRWRDHQRRIAAAMNERVRVERTELRLLEDYVDAAD